MATITPTYENIVGGTVRVTWANMLQSTSDVGAQCFAPDHTVKNVQVKGTFGAGGAVTIQGSLDGGTTWATLADPQGNALVISAASIEGVQETAASIRPAVTAGDGTTSLTVVMILTLDNVSS